MIEVAEAKGFTAFDNKKTYKAGDKIYLKFHTTDENIYVRNYWRPSGIANFVDYYGDTVITIPEVHPFVSPLLAIVPLQLFAYYISKEKGLDVDKPRNLAKSVTVE